MLIASWASGVIIMTLSRNHEATALLALVLFVTLVEYPRWTLLPVLSGQDGQVILFQTAATVVRLVGLTAGSLAFPTRWHRHDCTGWS